MPSPIDVNLKKKQAKGEKASRIVEDTRLNLSPKKEFNTPGPGSYYVNDLTLPGKTAKGKPFGQSTTRFDEERNKMYVPAPGAYKVDISLSESKSYRGGRYKPFGSHSDRFPEQKINSDPGVFTPN